MSIRRVYLYLTSLIGLILILIGTVQLVNLGLKTWVFPKADELAYVGPCYKPAPFREGEEPQKLNQEECEKQRQEEKTARKQADASRSIAFIIVGVPVWYYHWNKVKNERPE